MDYILFGMGFGASLMLIGWALRTFGPGWKYASVTDDHDPHLYVCKRFWNRFVQGLGGVLAIAGSATVVLTFLVMLSNPDDDTGTMYSLIIWVFISLIVFGWCWMYLSRYGCTGIWSREEGYGFRAGSKTDFGHRSPLRSRSKRAAKEAPMVASIVPADTALASADESEEIDEQADDASHPEDALDVERDDDSTTEDASDIDPEYDFGDSTDLTVPSEPISREIHLRD